MAVRAMPSAIAPRPGTNAGDRGKTVAPFGQDVRVEEARGVSDWHERVIHRDIVTTSAAQPADRPSVDDLALAGGQQHEADLRTAGRRRARLAIVIHDRRQNHPGRDLATADQRPATGQAEATVDDMRLTRGLRIVGRDDVRIVMDGVPRFGGELCCGPMRIAVPHAPRDRRVGFRQLLEHGDAVHWRQVEPAIGRRQENAKKAGVGEVAREIFRQPSGCFDSIALRDNTRLEVAGSCKKGSAIDRIVLHHYPHEHSNEACCSPARGQSAPPDMLPLPVPRPITSNTRTLASSWESFVSV